MANNNEQPIALLFYASTSPPLPYLVDEAKAIRKSLKASRACDVRLFPAATQADILDAINDQDNKDRIAIIHYAGHSNGDGIQLRSEDEAESAKLAHISGLAKVFGQPPNLQIVFINGCSSREQVLEFSEAGIPVIIATSTGIEDKTACNFAKSFYSALGSQQSVEDAFQAASNKVEVGTGKNHRAVYFGNYQESEPAKKNEWPWHIYGSTDDRQWKLKNEKVLSPTRFGKIFAIVFGIFFIGILGLIVFNAWRGFQWKKKFNKDDAALKVRLEESQDYIDEEGKRINAATRKTEKEIKNARDRITRDIRSDKEEWKRIEDEFERRREMSEKKFEERAAENRKRLDDFATKSQREFNERTRRTNERLDGSDRRETQSLLSATGLTTKQLNKLWWKVDQRTGKFDITKELGFDASAQEIEAKKKERRKAIATQYGITYELLVKIYEEGDKFPWPSWRTIHPPID